MLRKKMLETRERAISAQKLKTITTNHEMLPPGEYGVRYVLFSLSKALQKPVKKKDDESKGFFDPFAEENLDKDLFIDRLHGTHNLVLNKFNIVEEHLVLPTIDFEEQESGLSRNDFRAVWTAMQGLDAFGFFNCGYESGASQPRKHLQLMTYPCFQNYCETNMPPLLQFIHDLLQDKPKDEIVHIQELPFHHFIHRIDVQDPNDSEVAADHINALYQKIRSAMYSTSYPAPATKVTQAAGIEDGGGQGEAPSTEPDFVSFNLLITTSFVFVIPRRVQSHLGIEVNSIGFIGSYFVRSEEQRAFIDEHGPMELLRKVAFPPLALSKSELDLLNKSQ